VTLWVRHVAFEQVIGSHRDRDLLALVTSITGSPSIFITQYTPDLRHPYNQAMGRVVPSDGGGFPLETMPSKSRKKVTMSAEVYLFSARHLVAEPIPLNCATVVECPIFIFLAVDSAAVSFRCHVCLYATSVQ
jgi:hypothetical protein